MVVYSQIPQKSAQVFSKGLWCYHFSCRIHTNQRPGTHEPASWPFIKLELPTGLIQGQRLLTAAQPWSRGLCQPGSGALGAPRGPAMPGVLRAVTRVSLPQAAPFTSPREGPRGPQRSRSNWRMCTPGSPPGQFTATWEHS